MTVIAISALPCYITGMDKYIVPCTSHCFQKPANILVMGEGSERGRVKIGM